MARRTKLDELVQPVAGKSLTAKALLRTHFENLKNQFNYRMSLVIFENDCDFLRNVGLTGDHLVEAIEKSEGVSLSGVLYSLRLLQHANPDEYERYILSVGGSFDKKGREL